MQEKVLVQCPHQYRDLYCHYCHYCVYNAHLETGVPRRLYSTVYTVESRDTYRASAYTGDPISVTH